MVGATSFTVIEVVALAVPPALFVTMTVIVS
jgi:hypothetical protein